MCDSCCHGIHNSHNTANLQLGPRQQKDNVFGRDRGAGQMQTVSQPREVTRVNPRSVKPGDIAPRSNNTLNGRSDSHMNSRQDDNSNIKSVLVKISGKVQGVFYRKWTVENATKLYLNGWVRNCKDGTVEAIFSGKHSAVDHMVERCKVGPMRARVTGFEVSKADDPRKKGFEQLDDKY